jgi:hypothetical protein
VTSAQISITIKPFDENTLQLSFFYDELKVAAYKIIEIHSPIAGLLGASNRKSEEQSK